MQLRDAGARAVVTLRATATCPAAAAGSAVRT